MNVTATNIAAAINSLDKNVTYDYPNPRTKTKINIVNVVMPEGPIIFRRCEPNKGESFDNKADESISVAAIWRLASSLKPNLPVNVDRVFGASYNSRSALEAMLVHTENYYICYPGRLEKIGEDTRVRNGHKHIIFCPDKPHRRGIFEVMEVNDMVVSEVDREVYFDSLLLSENPERDKVQIEIDRRHAQIQIMLIKAAESIGLKSWVAKNDHSIKYDSKRLIEMDSVIKDLSNTAALQGYPNAARAGELIDLMWLDSEGRKIPAIIEIEHSTGVTSGLTRMKGFMEEAPDLAHMTFIISAPDEIREQVLRKANAPQFKDMNIMFLPYSAVEDLFLLSRRNLKGIDNIKFLHTFLEAVT
ncbi:Type II site-specific deoxyribonuclease [Paraglaciecola sp. T6c]|uniref:hypothetical protein n=1 Tax=Pseudoalteromonas atlantica (strain T6c / ATCC BAA-1087) TaxID=3042615 RepID=UPI00005C5929|nr:hypothetical protein [Paraglaciecola sp. T6c]ABG39254.1 Type II site-specific deoxyribonuclease [Paraglaciecola sp. T6c]